jgi:Tfp pilus assembly protein PilX
MLMRSSQPFSDSRRRGIALLLTIVLLVFLVLIMVAMSSLVKVETQISINTQSLAQARQNALFGLNSAIGKLQETAGPDQRVTARADLVVAAGSPQLNLTGVWDTSSGTPNLVTWLVNGNEDSAAPLEVTPDSAVKTETLATSTIMDANNLAENPLVDALYDDSNPAANPPAAFPSGLRFGAGHVYMVAGGSVDLEDQIGHKGKMPAAVSRDERVILRKSPIIIDGAKVPGKAPGNPVTVGNYAFWVSDDGIKASLGTGNRSASVAYDDAAGGNGTNYKPTANAANDQAYMNRKYINSLQLQEPRSDLVLRDSTGTDILAGATRVEFYGVLAHPKSENLRNELISPSQLDYSIFSGPFANPALLNVNPTTAFQGDVHDRLKQNYHDVTSHTYSVISNMQTGGLRDDLSQPAELAVLAPADFKDAVTAFVDAWRPTSGASVPLAVNTKIGLLQQVVTITPPAASAFTTGASAFPIVPVISEFEMYLDLYTDDSSSLEVASSIQLELWNPYNAVLKIPTGETLYIELPLVSGTGVESLGTVHVDGGGPIAAMSVARTLGWDGTTQPWSYRVALTPTKPGNWKPGEIKRWTADKTFPVKDIAGIAVDSGFNANVSDFPVDALASTLGVQLTMGVTSLTTKELYRVSGVPFAALALGPDNLDGLIYYFRLKDTENGVNPGWLNAIDPRGPQIAYSMSLFDTLTLDGIRSFDVDPYSLLRNDVSSLTTRIALFDIPRQEVLSVGAFQHLVYSVGGGSYKIGSNTAGNWNNVFDQYFFSSVPQTAAWDPKAGDVLANTSMVVFDPALHSNTSKADLLNTPPIIPNPAKGLQTKYAAEYLVQRDTLNINSTSIAAWRSILGGALPTLADPAAATAADRDDYVWDGITDIQMKANWRYFDGTNDVTQAVRNVFFRLPQTATNIGAVYSTLLADLGGNNTAKQRAAAYRLGLRELTKEQVDGMATNVVSQLKARGAPFVSVKAFIDSGFLQNAIDSQPTINNPSGALAIPQYSPGYLTQADILQLIGDRLVARSDTFTIRAYGDVVNPVSGAVDARAWVEATVQRTPNKHSSSATPADNKSTTGGAPGDGNFGRQFKVISMRWLGIDDI